MSGSKRQPLHNRKHHLLSLFLANVTLIATGSWGNNVLLFSKQCACTCRFCMLLKACLHWQPGWNWVAHICTRPGSMWVRSVQQSKVAFTAMPWELLGDVSLSLALGHPGSISSTRTRGNTKTNPGFVKTGFLKLSVDAIYPSSTRVHAPVRTHL